MLLVFIIYYDQSLLQHTRWTINVLYLSIYNCLINVYRQVEWGSSYPCFKKDPLLSTVYDFGTSCAIGHWESQTESKQSTKPVFLKQNTARMLMITGTLERSQHYFIHGASGKSTSVAVSVLETYTLYMCMWQRKTGCHSSLRMDQKCIIQCGNDWMTGGTAAWATQSKHKTMQTRWLSLRHHPTWLLVCVCVCVHAPSKQDEVRECAVVWWKLTWLNERHVGRCLTELGSTSLDLLASDKIEKVVMEGKNSQDDRVEKGQTRLHIDVLLVNLKILRRLLRCHTNTMWISVAMNSWVEVNFLKV